VSPRLVVVTTSYPRWPGDPAGSFVAGSVSALRRAGARVRVVAPDAVDARPDPRVRRVRYALRRERQALAYGAGIPDHLDRTPAAWLQAPALSAALLAGALAEARRADVVVGHWLLPGAVAGVLSARAHGLPHRAVLHSAGVAVAARLPGGPALARLVALGSDRLVFCSADLRSRFLALVGPRVARRVETRTAVQPMGFEPRSLGIPVPRRLARRRLGVAGRFVVGFLGRVVPIKGLVHLVRAAAGVERALVVVAGDGPGLPEVRAAAEAADVALRCLGRLEGEKRAGFLSACDVFAQPSLVLPDGRSEGTPLAVLEALSFGLPVIASRVGGLPEVVAEDRWGYLVPPGDEQALANRLHDLAGRPALRRRLAAAAREEAARHTWASVGPRLASLLLGAP